MLIDVVVKPPYISYQWFFQYNNDDEKVAGMVAENTIPLQRETISFEASNKNREYNHMLFSMHVQSDDVMDSGEMAGNVEEHETVSFVDAETLKQDYMYRPDSVVSSGATIGTDLANFLSRPTLINTVNWTTAATVGSLTQIEPWYQLLNNSVIKNKISNYAFFRAKLCMKFVINGTPFHFGMLRVAYEPSVNIANTGARKSKIRSNPTSTYPLLTPYSQLPGTYLYPSANAGSELCVPYFNHKSWVKLLSATDLKTLGTLTYYVAIPLDIASSSASTSVQINTYAWFEDVELSGSTNELVVQAGDEYTGVVSYPASALASISKKLESIPIISKYARATTIGSTALAQISSIFGFTNVPVIEDHKPFVPQPFSNLSTSEIGAPIHKLTLDPKQELSIDPSVANISSMDEMAIKAIISKETIFHVFDWATTDINGTVIANWRVTPMLFDAVPIVDGGLVQRSYRVYHSWLSYVGMLFTHWRGDIIFDVEVVCTKFHKGRLQISWDPEATSGTTQKPANAVYTTILDIGEVNKASIRVPFHQAFEWLRCRDASAVNWSIGGANTVNDEKDNGMLIVSVLNPLVSPVSPQTVHLVVKVRAADNFEFANPRSAIGNGVFAPSPSFFDVQSGDKVDIESQEVTFGDNGSKHPNRYDLNIGERIVSLRTLMRRMSLVEFTSIPDNAATRSIGFLKSYTKNLPSYGFDPNGLYIGTGLVNSGASFAFTSNPTHPITYISNMYGAYRGGINFTINCAGGSLCTGMEDARIQRVNDSILSAYKRGLIVTSTQSGNNQGIVNTTYQTGWPIYGTAGATFTNENTNAGLSFYYPMMTGLNFQYPDPYTAMNGSATDQSNSECCALYAIQSQASANNSTKSMHFTTYAGIGVDYSCLWLLCCPTVDYYSANVTVTA